MTKDGPQSSGRSYRASSVATRTPWVDAWDESRLSRFPSTLTFGLAGRGEGEWDWEFGFVEDFPPESPTVDFTVTLGIDRRFYF